MNIYHKCPYCEKVHEQACVPSNDGRHDNPCSKCKDKELVLAWIDSYNTWNHADDFSWDSDRKFYEDDLDEETGCLCKSGLKNIKENYPVSEVENYDEEGWVDCCHVYKFVANTIQEAKKIVREYFEEYGRNIDVFSVSHGNFIVMTEEDLYE
jgi:hypothetical protein